MPLLDEAAVERAAAGRVLRIPRGPHRGRLGDVRASSVGSSLELHDFRVYQPGDDVRHLDWNAVARTGELVLRVRQEEVSPRVEVLVDASASMGVSESKAARAREIALWLCVLAQRSGLEPVLYCVGKSIERVTSSSCRPSLSGLQMAGREAFDVALRRTGKLAACGLRLWVTDALFESAPQSVMQLLAHNTAALAVVQVLDPEDVDPSGGEGARLVDAESAEMLERILTPQVLRAYAERFEAHQTLWKNAAQRVRALWLTATASASVEVLASSVLAPLVEAA